MKRNPDVAPGEKTEGKAGRSRILIIDDHPIVRERLSQMINREADMVTSGEAEDATQALRQIRTNPPDLAIVDLSLKDSDGLTLIKDIRARRRRLPILVLSMHDESIYAERVLRAGARGYITKQEATQKVLTAIRHVLAGEIYISEKLSAGFVERWAKAPTDEVVVKGPQLSDREMEVFRRFGVGQGSREIAESFQISQKTVESYRARIRKKLGIKSPTQFLQRAVQWVEGEGRK